MKEKLFCVVCGNELIGKQEKYCSKQCKSKDYSKLLDSNKRIKYQDTQNKRRVLNKLKLISEFGNKCSICGYNKNISALEFHHIDPNEKEFHLGNAKTTNLDKLLLEMDKCILVCANCHRELHYPNEILN